MVVVVVSVVFAYGVVSALVVVVIVVVAAVGAELGASLPAVVVEVGIVVGASAAFAGVAPFDLAAPGMLCFFSGMLSFFFLFDALCLRLSRVL